MEAYHNYYFLSFFFLSFGDFVIEPLSHIFFVAFGVLSALLGQEHNSHRSHVVVTWWSHDWFKCEHVFF
jgi:hypothetical protein